ncbi:MAG: hypothetical protein KatS3mg088_525 [Patescibacteria group bacterium]|nr:MAG: hypothetical protein KatS3mg088_525 [Patescibacteria group bacterium]
MAKILRQMSVEQPNRVENEEKGDYFGYQVKTDEGIGIQIIGPLSKAKAIEISIEITNTHGATTIRTFGENKGQAILRLLEAFKRTEDLQRKGILP